MIAPREARWSTIVLFLLVQPILLVPLLLSRTEVLLPLARATRWVLHPDLVAGGILLLVVIGGVVLRGGGLRAADVGLVRAHVPVALLVTTAFWVITQLVLVLASLLHTGGLVPHPSWREHGAVVMLSFLIAMLLGMALYEEVAIRGFLFPQLFLKLPGADRARIWTAAVLSAAYFALLHIPTRMMMGGVSGAALLPHLAVLTGAGLFGVVLYLRTENLLVVTGIHALVNAPTQVVAAPLSPFVVTVLLAGVLWVAWPRLVPRTPPDITSVPRRS